MESVPSDFSLTGSPVPARIRGFYKLPLKGYEECYETTERTVKRWVKVGKNSVTPELPPLDDPPLMPEWWRKHMHQRVPDAILRAAAQKGHAAPASPVPPSAPSPPASPPASPAPEITVDPRDFSSVEALDLEANVQHLRRSLAIAAKLFDEARGRDDENLTASRQRQYQSLLEPLRKAENDLLDWQQKKGVLVAKEEVRAENNRIASTVFQAVRRLVKNVRPQLVGKTDSEQDQLWNNEVLACFASLKGSRFTTFDPALQ